MENNIWQKQIPAKSGISKANKLPTKKNPSRVIQSIEIKNCYSPLETEGSPIENWLTNTKVTAKQSSFNLDNKNKQNANDKTESDTPNKRKLPVTVILDDPMVKDI